MIKLEIPVENDEDIVNMSLSREEVEQFLPQTSSDPIPDLILSATGQTRPRTYSGQSLSRETQSSLSNSPLQETPASHVESGNSDSVSCAADVSWTEVQPSLVNQSVKSAIAIKRDSLRRSRHLHRTISDDGKEPLKLRRGLERENELAETSLEDIHIASMNSDFTTNADKTYDDDYASIIVTTSDLASAAADDADSNDVEMQFLRTLQTGITRAMQSPMKIRKCEPNGDEEETWC